MLSMLFVVNSDVMLALCYAFCKSLCNYWIIRYNKDLCILVLHLVLCVLAIDPGTCTDTHRDRHPKKVRSLQMVSEHCVDLRFVTLGLD